MLLAAFVIVAGLALVVYGTVSSNTLLGVAGFVVMLAAAAFGMQSRRKGQAPDLHAVGGTATRRTRQTRKAGFIDRLEDRWRQRPEGHR